MKLKNTIIISSYVLLAALIFSASYFVGKSTIKKEEPPMPAPTAAAETVETVSENNVNMPFYEVTMEEGRLIIYKCIGNTKSVVTSEAVSESVFPREDIAELKKGVVFDRLDGAQQMFENFVS